MPTLPIFSHRPSLGPIQTLCPSINDGHPLGCGTGDEFRSDHLRQARHPTRSSAAAYTKHADELGLSDNVAIPQRDEMDPPRCVRSHSRQIVIEAFDQIIGLDLTHLSIDGCCVKAPCGGDNTGPNPTDRGKSGQKRSCACRGPRPADRVHSRRVQTDTIPHCCGRLWSVCPGSGSSCPSVSASISIPDTIRLGHSRLVDRVRMRMEDLSERETFIEINLTRWWTIERTNSWHHSRIQTLASGPRSGRSSPTRVGESGECGHCPQTTATDGMESVSVG